MRIWQSTFNPMNITQLEMTAKDRELATEAATAKGYTQIAYTSSSDLIGLFCLRDGNADRKPAGCFVKTQEFGLLFISDLEDLQLHELAARQIGQITTLADNLPK